MPRLTEGQRQTRRPDASYSYWTAEEDAAIRDGCERGLTFEKIAAALGPHRTRGSVAGRASRLGVRTRTRAIQTERVQAAEAKKRARDPRKGSFTPRSGRSEGTLPYGTTKSGTLLHVYSRDPYALHPVATYVLVNDWWVRRDRPEERHPTQKAAARAASARVLL